MIKTKHYNKIKIYTDFENITSTHITDLMFVI